MIQFGIFVALLIAIALCFVLIPLWLKPKIVSDNTTDINVALSQKKLQSLENDLATGEMTQAQCELLKNELMLNLHRDLQKQNAPKIDENKGRWLAIPLAVFIPLLSLAIYSVKGDLRAFDEVAVKGEAQQARPSAEQINGMVEKLAQKMKENPTDPKGWMMLSRSYKVLKRYGEAIDAMRKARAIVGDDPETLLQLADVIAMSSGGTLIGEPTELITKALEIDANNEMGLWLNGLANAEARKFNEAIASWQKLQTHYKPEDADFQEVQGLINQAKEALLQPAK